MLSEKNTRDKCIEQISSLEPVKKVNIKIHHEHDTKIGSDGSIEIYTFTDKISMEFIVKGNIRRPVPEQLRHLSFHSHPKPILLAEYVNNSIAKDLKKWGVNYIDCQGNCFIDIPEKVYIEIQGKKKRNIYDRSGTAVFNTKGMQLLTLLLNDLTLINQPIRKLKNLSNISHERTSTSIRDLKKLGYLYESSKGKYSLTMVKKLFNKWVENYGDRLRPYILLETYRISSKYDLNKIKQLLSKHNINFAFGGETGGEILSNYYRSENIDIFIEDDNLNNLIRHLNLIPARNYNLRLFKLYSNEIIDTKNKVIFPTVLPILIYAELLYSRKDRAINTADVIYKKYIEDLLI